jgi:hypothetical protein
MSTPIQKGELSPEDPKFYAPPRWRSGEITAPPIQPSLRAPEVPNSQAYAGGETRQDDREARYDNVPMNDGPKAPMAPVADAFLKPSEHSHKLGRSGVRTKALTIAAGVVVWTAFCIAIGLGRLDTISFAHLRNDASTTDPKISVSERPQAANITLPQVATSAPQNVSRQVLAPTLAVADAIGEANGALPLVIKVSNSTPGTTINLSGLVAGTTLSAGAAAGEGQWRIAIDDLPNTQVLPPAAFVGPMKIVAELRGAEDQAIVRTSLQLVWRPAAGKSSEAAEPTSSPAATAAIDDAAKEVPVGQVLAWQKESAVDQPTPRLKARKHISRSTKESSARKRRHKPVLEMETDTISRWQQAPSSNYAVSAYSDARMDRKRFFNDDLQTLIDRSWERCKYDCGREPRR